MPPGVLINSHWLLGFPLGLLVSVQHQKCGLLLKLLVCITHKSFPNSPQSHPCISQLQQRPDFPEKLVQLTQPFISVTIVIPKAAIDATENIESNSVRLSLWYFLIVALTLCPCPWVSLKLSFCPLDI